MPDAYDEDEDGKMLGKTAKDKKFALLNQRYTEEKVNLTEQE